MNFFELRRWSARQQVLVIILLVGLLVGVLWFSLLFPINRECRDLKARIDAMQVELQRKGLLRNEETLQALLQQEDDAYRVLVEEWRATMERLAGLPDQRRLTRMAVGYIDFKVALAETRKRLTQAAQAGNVRLPPSLGLDEGVESGENPRHLLLQLRSVERLLNLLIDLKIVAVREVRPMPPILHTVGEGGEEYMEEYPMEVEFLGTLENLYVLFGAILEPRHVFFVKNVRIESAASDEKPDLLKVRLMMSLLLFVKDPEEFRPVPRPKRKLGPSGA